MSPSDDQLLAAASAARARAYAPYSRFLVGAALLSGGQQFSGANIENASYAVTTCAERVAIGHMVMAGLHLIDAIAIVTQGTDPAPPCGVCLQALREFTTDPATMRIILGNLRGDREITTLAELLPRSFARDDLTPADGEP